MLNEWLDVHERELRATHGLKSQTISNRTVAIRHCRRLWGERPMRALKPHEIAAGIREAFLPKKSSTAQRVLAEIRDAFAGAVEAGWCDVNPALPVKTPRHRVKRKRLKYEVWVRMRDAARATLPKWVEAMLLLALITGQRRADLAKMRFDDVFTDDDGQQYLRVVQQKEAGKGFGAKVEIPLSLRLDAIGVTLGGVIEYCRTCGKPGPTLLRKAGGGQIEVSSLSARFGEAIRMVLGRDAYEMHEWPRLHEVRSLAARMYKAQGIDTQTLLGHKHKEMTELYEDERDLAQDTWKRVQLVQPDDVPSANGEAFHPAARRA